MPHFIYVIGRVSGPVKVGISAKPEERVKYLQCGCPFQIWLLAVAKVRSRLFAYNIEQSFHSSNSEERRKGEWFDMTADLASEGVTCVINAALHFEEEYKYKIDDPRRRQRGV